MAATPISRLSIIIPAFNEEETLGTVLDRIRLARLPDGVAREVIIVDDGSTDDTAEVVKAFLARCPDEPVRYLAHPRNRGKGAALRTGIREATGEYLIVQDADLEYDPDEYERMLLPVLRGDAHVVYGSRFRGGLPNRKLFFWHAFGNRLLTFLSNAFTNLNLTDMETGFKLVRTSLAQRIPLEEQRFGVEPEITAKLARVPGIKFYEVGISYYGRSYAEGKKINWKDGLRALYCILKYNVLQPYRPPFSAERLPPDEK